MKTKFTAAILLNQAILAITFSAALFGASAGRADTIYVSNSGNNTIEKFTGGVGSVFARFELS
jgi:hypothetical protein